MQKNMGVEERFLQRPYLPLQGNIREPEREANALVRAKTMPNGQRSIYSDQWKNS